MKTQRFVVEITTPKSDSPIKDYELIAVIDSGFGFPPDWRIEVMEDSND